MASDEFEFLIRNIPLQRWKRWGFGDFHGRGNGAVGERGKYRRYKNLALGFPDREPEPFISTE